MNIAHTSRRRTPRGFTLLEVMLASMLGLIVVIAAMGLFTTLSTSDRQSNESYHRQMELALTHQTVERSLRILLMDPTKFPLPTALGANNPGNASGKRDSAKALTEADGTAAVDTPRDLPKRPRMILEPDNRLPPAMRYEDEKGVVTYITPQRLEVTLSRPPVFAPPTQQELLEARYNEAADTAAMNQRRSRRPGDAGNRSAQRSGARGGSGSTGTARNTAGAARSGKAAAARPSNDQLTETARRAGVSADELAAATGGNGAGTNVDPAAASEDESSEVALAPGLRGVFEIRWDPDRSSDARRVQTRSQTGAIDQTQGSWSLWWRPVPDSELLLRNAGEPVPDYLTASDRLLPDGSPATDLARGSVMLVSNLETCRWEMVRTGVTTDTFYATWQDELPALTTLEMRTRSGLWMKWMFEVDWTRGDEPGKPFTGANAAFTTPGNINQLNQGNRNGINNGNNKGNPRGANGASFLENRSGGK